MSPAPAHHSCLPQAGTWARLSAAATFDHRLSAEALRVLAALGTYSDEIGSCYPAVSTIALRLGLSRRMVQRHLRRLESAGYISTHRQKRVVGGGWSSNAYLLLFPVPTKADPGESDATPDVASPAQIEGEISAPDAERCDIGVSCDATPDDATHATPDDALTIPSEESQRELSQSRARDLKFGCGEIPKPKAALRGVHVEAPPPKRLQTGDLMLRLLKLLGMPNTVECRRPIAAALMELTNAEDDEVHRHGTPDARLLAIIEESSRRAAA